MDNKFRAILSFVLILTSTVTYSQLKYEFNFDKNEKILLWKISNETSVSLILLHPMGSGDFDKSYFMIDFFDGNGRSIFKVSRQFTDKTLDAFEPGTIKTYRFNIKKFVETFQIPIKDVCCFKIYGTVMTVSKDKSSHRSSFEETYQWNQE